MCVPNIYLEIYFETYSIEINSMNVYLEIYSLEINSMNVYLDIYSMNYTLYKYTL